MALQATHNPAKQVVAAAAGQIKDNCLFSTNMKIEQASPFKAAHYISLVNDTTKRRIKRKVKTRETPCQHSTTESTKLWGK